MEKILITTLAMIADDTTFNIIGTLQSSLDTKKMNGHFISLNQFYNSVYGF